MKNLLPPDFDPDYVTHRGGSLFALPTAREDAALVLIPVPWEATASFRLGTAAAPAAILAAGYQVEFYDRQFGHPYEAGISMTEPDPRIADLHKEAAAARKKRNFPKLDAICQRLYQIVEEISLKWHRKGKIVGIVGGEHGVGLGAIKAAARDHQELGLLQVDAHADLRTQFDGIRYGHASFAANVLADILAVKRIVQVGVRDLCCGEAQRIIDEPRMMTFFDGEPEAADFGEIVDCLPENVWVSLDIDGLDPSLCPNTGTPVPGGLSWNQAIDLLGRLADSGRRVIGFDLCEVVPEQGARQPGDGWDETVGARMLFKLCGCTLKASGLIP